MTVGVWAVAIDWIEWLMFGTLKISSYGDMTIGIQKSFQGCEH
jgi:hypothetical protein